MEAITTLALKMWICAHEIDKLKEEKYNKIILLDFILF